MTPVCRPKSNVPSTICLAAANPASTSPLLAVRSYILLSPNSGCSTGVSGFSAVSMSATGVFSVQSTVISSAASSAIERVSATTATTGSPCQVARSTARAYCGTDFKAGWLSMVPVQGVMRSAISFPVTTATTPGSSEAAFVSMLPISA